MASYVGKFDALSRFEADKAEKSQRVTKWETGPQITEGKPLGTTQLAAEDLAICKYQTGEGSQQRWGGGGE